jgi:hypothetical protein
MKDITVFGHKVSPLAAGAVVIGSGVVIWFAYKQHEASAASTTSATSIDPVTGLPYSQDSQIDPLTGQAYLAEAQEYGSVSAAEQAVAGESAVDLSGASGYGSGLVGTSTGTSLVPANDVQATTYATNAAWAQAVEAGLTDVGYSSTDISAALGRYLGNLSETSAQATIVDAAMAEYGPPPTGTYTVILAPTTTATGSGASGSGTSTATGTPQTAPDPISISPGAGAVSLSWPAVGGATGYEYDITGPEGSAAADATVTATSAHVALPAKTGYQLKMRAKNSAGAGPWGATKTFNIAK